MSNNPDAKQAGKWTGKPSHVRQLNFGESVLNWTIVEGQTAQKGDRLVLNTLGVPSRDRQEYVREWVETHRVYGFGNCAHLDQVSDTRTVSGTPSAADSSEKQASRALSVHNRAVENAQCSYAVNANKQACNLGTGYQGPVQTENKSRDKAQGMCVSGVNEREARTRVRGLKCVNSRENMIVERNGEVLPTEFIENKDYGIYQKAKENIPSDSHQYRNARESTLWSSCKKLGLKRSNIDRSSGFSRDSYHYKRKRQRVREDSSEPLQLLNNNFKNANINSVISEGGRMDSVRVTGNHGTTVQTKGSEAGLITDVEHQINEDTSSAKSGNSNDLFSDVQSNSHSDLLAGDNVAIDTGSSKNGDSDDSANVNINIESDATIHDTIEDADTQDAIPSAKKSCTLESLRAAGSKTNSIYSKTSEDSDATYFSGGVQRRATDCRKAMERISEDPSLIVGDQQNESSWNEINISTATSPQRQNSDPLIEFDLLDSAKKKKKPKRGTLRGKLRSLLNSQISFLRIWRHRVKQAKISKTTRGIIVRVREHRTKYTRQFFQGVVLEDPFDLLPPRNSNVNGSILQNNVGRLITLVTLPEIVGRIEMKPHSIVQVAAPWDVLDNENLVINAIYIKAISSGENASTEPEPIPGERIIRTTKQFNCDCIQVNRLVRNCKKGKNKPDVMEQLFPSLRSF